MSNASIVDYEPSYPFTRPFDIAMFAAAARSLPDRVLEVLGAGSAATDPIDSIGLVSAAALRKVVRGEMAWRKQL